MKKLCCPANTAHSRLMREIKNIELEFNNMGNTKIIETEITNENDAELKRQELMRDTNIHTVQPIFDLETKKFKFHITYLDDFPVIYNEI